ncbi:glycosyltransferase like family 2-domain-containing protein [Gorgonomyces haynaldii]|nr:glycosyltransferase like family 2-domain-containing protein [Gorgonomyces haynaldii]
MSKKERNSSSSDKRSQVSAQTANTAFEDTPETRAGPAASQSLPRASKAADDQPRTNLGNTKVVMALLSEMWLFSLVFILGGTYAMTFHVPQFYIDDEVWNETCWWKLAWILPMPYTLVCFFGLTLPFRTPKFLYTEDLPKRRLDNLYILTVTKGDNKDAVLRSWNAHKHLEAMHPAVRVHVLTDEPYFFENINCYTCPKSFKTANSKYKARALEWYRQTMRYTEHDWVLHLDEESVIDDESVKRVLEFIWYEHDYHWGQGVILYNQYRYWTNWVFTVADAIRVGDDLSRFQLQYSYFHAPVFGAHGSFLLCNGAVENAITWDLGSLTEDYQFATHAMELGYKCGKVPGLVREQSPMDLIGFLKQRRRWYVGIRRLPLLLPKIWWFFWTIGTLSLYGTIASIILGFFVPLGTPRWFGFLKDFSFCTFVYLYLIGIFIQDLDKKKNPILIILHIPMTIVIQFIACILEAWAVMYGLIFPPADFDVIKK